MISGIGVPADENAQGSQQLNLTLADSITLCEIVSGN